MRGLALKDDEVRALMRDGVVVVRRVVPEKILDAYYDYDEWCRAVSCGIPSSREWEKEYFTKKCPIGQPGERRFVKERFKRVQSGRIVNGEGRYRSGIVYSDDSIKWRKTETVVYTHDLKLDTGHMQFHKVKWRPSVHMRAHESRTHTECTHAKAEQVDGVWRWAATYKRVEG